jgi:hypothetical protein
MAMLLFEGIGTILVFLINVAGRLGRSPLFLYDLLFSPLGGFGVLTLSAAIGIFRYRTWGTVLAIASQLIVLGLGFAGLKNNPGGGLAVMSVAALGLALAFRTARAR